MTSRRGSEPFVWLLLFFRSVTGSRWPHTNPHPISSKKHLVAWVWWYVGVSFACCITIFDLVQMWNIGHCFYSRVGFKLVACQVSKT